jgi:hypothetical protein
MRRLHAWITGAVGGVAAYRLLRRSRPAEQAVEPLPGQDPRADELRAKLAEAQLDDAEPVADESPEERRRRVHEQARGAIDEMEAE